ncbi:MAG: T9SS type A sorting domain-containing protein, partial [Ignavibacteriae bacterium]|nr:T9SS type A sorting domain-containing protein [Ignavibacteriota bacterium]
QNYPNPFNPTTTINFSIPEINKVGQSNNNTVLKVYDILGKEIATLVNEIKAPGNYQVQFDATSLTSGIYFYRLKSGEFLETKKMILLK